MKEGTFYSKIARPLLFSLDPEFTHKQTIRTGAWISRSRLARSILRRTYNIQFPELRVQAMGLEFQNPVGLAAGFDKQAYIYPLIDDIGFGHIEIGSVSLLPWRGNPSPTLLRLPKDGALINRLGLNSEGAEAVARRLATAKLEIPVGINVVKTADPAISGDEAIEDFLQCFARLAPLGNFVTLNLSCPNTAEGRTFEDPEMLVPFLEKLSSLRAPLAADGTTKPVLIKVSPDLDDGRLDEILALARQHGIDGCVVSNTTTRRQNLQTPKKVLDDFGFGGLSGHPLKRYAQEMIGKVFARTKGQFLIVACGGVGCDPATHPAEEVWQYLRLGATLVQLHTGLIYRGPAITSIISRGLHEILKRERFFSLKDFFAQRQLRANHAERQSVGRNE